MREKKEGTWEGIRKEKERNWIEVGGGQVLIRFFVKSFSTKMTT